MQERFNGWMTVARARDSKVVRKQFLDSGNKGNVGRRCDFKVTLYRSHSFSSWLPPAQYIARGRRYVVNIYVGVYFSPRDKKRCTTHTKLNFFVNSMFHFMFKSSTSVKVGTNEYFLALNKSYFSTIIITNNIIT